MYSENVPNICDNILALYLAISFIFSSPSIALSSHLLGAMSNNIGPSYLVSVSRLMGGSNMGNVASLSACNVTDNKAMQFPLTNRRRRRILFTQAQVSSFHST